MYVETQCPGCGRQLRVGVEHAGQTARCPICSAVYTVPEPQPVVADPADHWWLQTPEGKEYGPVPKTGLESWISEGRVTDDCRLLCEADGVWRDAGALYPVLCPEPSAPVELTADGTPVAFRGHVVNAHRGGTILAMGILSWAIGCPPFGILAWVMGSNDLLEMREGIMDSRGRAMTEAGRIIGMLHTFAALVLLVIGILAMLMLGIV